MTRSRARTLLPLLLAGLLALVVAACGGASSASGTGAAGTGGKAAQAIPADALAFVDANIDQGSDAWKKLDALGSRFPGWSNLTGRLQGQLESGTSDGLSFRRDVEPWLGGEAGVAVTSLAPTATSVKPVVVAYVQSTDDGKLEDALQRSGKTQKIGSRDGYDLFRGSDRSGDGPTYAAVGNGALLASNDEAALGRSIDAREGKSARLADLDRFRTALGDLPDDNLVVGYVDGPGLSQLFDLAVAQARSRTQGTPLPTQQLDQLRSRLDALRGASFSFGAEDEGFRLRAVSLVDEAKAQSAGVSFQAFTPSLLGRVPATAFAYLGLHDLGPSLQRVLDQASAVPGVASQIQALESQSGVSLKKDLIPLLSGEQALYLGAGSPVTAGLLLHPPDAATGASTLRKLVAAVSRLVPGVTATDLPNGQGQRLTTGSSGTSVLWRKAGDVLAISNDPTAGDTPARSLKDSAAFKRVQDEAGQSGDVTGILYADIPGIVDLASSLGQGIHDPEAKANLAHVGPFLAWSTAKGGTATTDAFLEVRK